MGNILKQVKDYAESVENFWTLKLCFEMIKGKDVRVLYVAFELSSDGALSSPCIGTSNHFNCVTAQSAMKIN